LWKMKQAKDDYVDEFGSQPTAEELADLLGVSIKTLKNIMQCASSTISLDSPIGYSENSSGGRTLKEVIPDVESQNLEDAIQNKEVANLIRLSLHSLSEREEKVIRLRFGITENPKDHIGYPITQQELASLQGNKRRKSK